MNAVPNPLPVVPPFTTSPSDLTSLKKKASSLEGLDYINHHQLASSSVDSTANKVCLFETLYLKKARSIDDKQSMHFRDKSKQTCTYDRLLFAIDHNAPSGSNVVVFLLGKGQCENLFKGWSNLRDSGVFGEFMLFTSITIYHLDII